jgi:hypothetical protein
MKKEGKKEKHDREGKKYEAELEDGKVIQSCPCA